MEENWNLSYRIRKLTEEKIGRLLMEDPWSRAMLAKLRRGIGKQPGELPELLEIVLSNNPEDFYGKGDEISKPVWAIYTALTLFALHQQGKDHPMSSNGNAETKKPGNSLGAAVGCLVKKGDEDRELAIKRRFDAVVTANEFTEFAYHARSIIQLLKAEDITLDYPRLAEDCYWCQFDEVRNQIRLRWGEDYYRIAQRSDHKENGGVHNE
ncbi:MAG TPA: type I-E CRISPR-associated protein Cse2/CasB [Clostridiales bacterium]|nr:type I-E CRISPR-associated protein Cse2/CasB [Clostridiales bacterium]